MTLHTAEPQTDGPHTDGPGLDGRPDAAVPAQPVVVTPLPTGAEVRELLNGLFDRPVTVQEEPEPVLPGRGVCVVGSYVDQDGGIRALAMTDLVLGCGLGAALALVEAARVTEALESGAVPVDLADNTQEVLGIASSLFAAAAGAVRLRAVQVAPDPVPDDVVAFLRAEPHRSDLTIEVPGYGTGVLVLLLARDGT